MALNDPIFAIRVTPNTGDVANLDYVDQSAIPYPMEYSPVIISGKTETIEFSKISGVYRIQFFSGANLISPAPTPLPSVKLSMTVFKLPNPTQTINIEFQDFFVWDVPQAWVQYLTSLSITTDSTTSFPVKVKVWGR